MTNRNVQCPHCPRRFENENAAWQHCKAKHKGKSRRMFSRATSDDEPSLADELVDAIQAHAAGESVADYLLTMLPEHFEERQL